MRGAPRSRPQRGARITAWGEPPRTLQLSGSDDVPTHFPVIAPNSRSGSTSSEYQRSHCVRWKRQRDTLTAYRDCRVRQVSARACIRFAIGPLGQLIWQRETVNIHLHGQGAVLGDVDEQDS